MNSLHTHSTGNWAAASTLSKSLQLLLISERHFNANIPRYYYSLGSDLRNILCKHTAVPDKRCKIRHESEQMRAGVTLSHMQKNKPTLLEEAEHNNQNDYE